MKKHVLQNGFPINWTFTAFLFLTSLVSLAGCGFGNPSDAELDRVPNVPPSTRAAEGAAVVDPTGR